MNATIYIPELSFPPVRGSSYLQVDKYSTYSKYSQSQCSIWLKRRQLLGLWGLVYKKYAYEFVNSCGRQEGLMLGFQTYLKFFEIDECSISTQ